MDSMYDETERELSMKNMSNYGLNPAATKLLVEDYKKKCAPYPIRLFISVGNSPIIRLSEVCGDVEIYLATPGYVGKAGKGDASLLDKFPRRMVAKSYSDNISPRMISFVLDGVEIAIKTKGVDEGVNIARNIFNPTK